MSRPRVLCTFDFCVATRSRSAFQQKRNNLGVYDVRAANEKRENQGVKDALVIELNPAESWSPGPVTLDDSSSHIHVIAVGSSGAISEVVEEPVDVRTPTTGGIGTGRVWVEYSQGQLLVYLNSTGSDKPWAPQVTTSFDMKSFFKGTSVFVGFTAGTGGITQNHEVTSWEMKSTGVAFGR